MKLTVRFSRLEGAKKDAKDNIVAASEDPLIGPRSDLEFLEEPITTKEGFFLC